MGEVIPLFRDAMMEEPAESYFSIDSADEAQINRRLLPIGQLAYDVLPESMQQQYEVEDLRIRKEGYRVSSGEGLQGFLQQIGEYELLTPQQEREFASKIIEGKNATQRLLLDGIRGASGLSTQPLYSDEEKMPLILEGLKAREALTVSNLRLVVSIAKSRKFGPYGSLEDKIGYGILGMSHAIDKFDPDKGFKFSTYATLWIRQEIMRNIDANERPVSIPGYQAPLARKISQNQGDEEALKKMSIDFNTSRENMAILSSVVSVGSLDEPYSRNGGSFEERIPDEHASIEMETAFDHDRLSTILDFVSQSLSAREAEVVLSYYGINGPEPMTDLELSQQFDLSRERVRQIRNAAIQKLRERVDYFAEETGLNEYM